LIKGEKDERMREGKANLPEKKKKKKDQGTHC